MSPLINSLRQGSRGSTIRPAHGTRSVPHVLLDFDGVLYDHSAWRRWLLSLLVRMGLHTHYSAFFRVWDREFQPDVWSGRCEFWAALRRFLHASGLSPGQVDEVEASMRGKRRLFEEDIRAFRGVPAAVTRLLEIGVDLSVVSRAPRDAAAIRGQLARLGLEALLTDVVATSDSCFLDDPVGFFHWILRQRRWQPGSAAFVGRDPADLAGAAEAGIWTIAFNYDADAVADLYLDQFDQLVALVGPREQLLAAG